MEDEVSQVSFYLVYYCVPFALFGFFYQTSHSLPSARFLSVASCHLVLAFVRMASCSRRGGGGGGGYVVAAAAIYIILEWLVMTLPLKLLRLLLPLPQGCDRERSINKRSQQQQRACFSVCSLFTNEQKNNENGKVE